VSGRLDGRVAIVTGAGRGIGRGEALALAAEGAAVVVNDLGGGWDGAGSDRRPAQDVVDEIRAVGGQAVANGDDVTDWVGAQRLVRQAVDTFGDLDILVNNAGILRDAMCFSMGEQDWDAVIRVHLRGHFCPTRFAAEYWRAQHKSGIQRRRAIVNTTSESGLFGNAAQSNYDAAKLGVVSMTVAQSKELARYGVTVNAVAPRARTRLTVSTFDGTSRSGEFAELDGSVFDDMDPDNIGPFIAFLASHHAEDVTGQVFIVWGGTIAHVRLPHVADVIAQDHRWSVAELAARKAGLFAEVTPSVYEGPKGYARLPRLAVMTERTT
jgi:NAD(P)-dependent dehydrogenase (short-subunit alcohol dehydrogenase family)